MMLKSPSQIFLVLLYKYTPYNFKPFNNELTNWKSSDSWSFFTLLNAHEKIIPFEKWLEIRELEKNVD